MFPFPSTFPANRIKGLLNLGPGGGIIAPAGVVGPFIGLSNDLGNIFFVDPVNGNDAWDGSRPVRLAGTTQGPKRTTAAAYALTLDAHNDVIARLPGLEAVTATLALDRRAVAIVKVTNGFTPWKPEDCAYFWAAATGPIFRALAPTMLVGLEMSAIWADGGTAALNGCDLELNGNAGGYAGNFCEIAYCAFPGWGEAGGICHRGDGFNHIYRCLFEAAGPTTPGLNFGLTLRGDVNNCDEDIIEECIIAAPIGVQSPALGNAARIQILNNKFPQPCAIAVQGVNFNPAFPSSFEGNVCGMVEAAAMTGAKAGMEAAGMFESGNFYSDGPSPRA